MKRSRLTKRERKAWNARRRAQYPEPTPAELEAMRLWAIHTIWVTPEEACAMFPGPGDDTPHQRRS